MTWKIVKHKIQFAKKLAEWKRTPAPHHDMEKHKIWTFAPVCKEAGWLENAVEWWLGAALACYNPDWCFVVFCCVALRCVALRCFALRCFALLCVVLCCVVLCCAVLYCVVCYWPQVSPALLQSRLAANLQWWALAAASCTPDSRLQVYNLQFTIFPNLRITI